MNRVVTRSQTIDRIAVSIAAERDAASFHISQISKLAVAPNLRWFAMSPRLIALALHVMWILELAIAAMVLNAQIGSWVQSREWPPVSLLSVLQAIGGCLSHHCLNSAGPALSEVPLTALLLVIAFLTWVGAVMAELVAQIESG